MAVGRGRLSGPHRDGYTNLGMNEAKYWQLLEGASISLVMRTMANINACSLPLYYLLHALYWLSGSLEKVLIGAFSLSLILSFDGIFLFCYFFFNVDIL